MVIQLIKNFFKNQKKKEPLPDWDVEELRVAFKDRYHNFKLLLSANNKALEIMANIEKALQGDEPFGMSFVKSCCIGVSVNVYRLIKNLTELAPGKYQELFEYFDEIQKKVAGVLAQKKIAQDDRLLIPLKDIHVAMTDMVGSKMANLGELKNKVRLRVPPGFVITAYAYQQFLEYNDLQTEIDRKFTTADVSDMEELYNLSADIQQMIIRAEIPDEIKIEIIEAWNNIEAEAGGAITVAIRSSALGEDSAGSSFAGQYRSELNVSQDHVFHAYKQVVASKYSLQAITYRLNRGFRDEDVSMCVGALVMVDAVCGGVIYSRNPVNIGDDSVFINSAWGLPKSVVDGSVDCDLIVVSRTEQMAIIREDIKNKEKKFVCYPEEGVCRIDLTGENRLLPSITQEQALELADFAVVIEEYYGVPQDIEWAIDQKGKIYFLQCRPLQQMESSAVYESDSLHAESIAASGGITASPGAASGPVFIVSKGSDVLEFPQGAILVTSQALPRWASLLNRAVAVVTEQGGFAGHLANVAREFQVPALFGVEGITEKLVNGDIVTVNANSLTIYRGRIEEILSHSAQKKHLMEGSPVYETLRQVSQHIIPLYLLNPDDPEFKPANCTTYHDITRFVHEKSVHEMFNFGKEHNFSERSAKQLYYKVPMQWWILNLDDGFTEEITGKYVKLEDIASIPMIALWEGIVAVPWDGPPPIDGKGLASVMFQATVNRSLNTGVKSKYSDRNYFMISKHYCSLSSRLGFHFSVLEALISERNSENYISFQFKGGAADVERRVLRARFVGEILEEYGFRIEPKEDAMFSRIEGYDEEFMKQRLRVVGYLTMHARQLDMIMTNPNKVSYYRAKIHKDINDVVLHIGKN